MRPVLDDAGPGDVAVRATRIDSSSHAVTVQ